MNEPDGRRRAVVAAHQVSVSANKSTDRKCSLPFQPESGDPHDMASKIILFTGASFIFAVIAWPSRDEVEKWAILAFGIALSALPVAKRWALEMISWGKASREARRKDCIEDLRRERSLTCELKSRIRQLEAEVDDWKRRFDTGTGDHPKVG